MIDCAASIMFATMGEVGSSMVLGDSFNAREVL
jgi:hypothetical protein